MKTRVDINDRLIQQATRLTGVRNTRTLVHVALEAFVAREFAKHLAVLAASNLPDDDATPRRARRRTA